MTEKNVANSAENPGKMSQRLIDADALWEAVGEIELPRGAYYVAVELQKAFDAAPTVDAVPVVHGRWIEQPDETHFCSECGKDALWEQYDKYCFHEKLTDICPNCGAKMDLEDKDATN